MNCALGPKEMRPLIEELSRIAPVYVSAHPNAGLPNPLLPTGFPETPDTLGPAVAGMGTERMAEHCRRGAAGPHPRTSSSWPNRFAGSSRRVQFRQWSLHTRLSGLEALTIRPDANFVNIGERMNVTGSPAFAKLILQGNYERPWRWHDNR